MVTKRNPFTIHNLPYGIISTEDNTARRCAVAFNEWAVDLGVLWQTGLFDGIADIQENVFKNVGAPREPDVDLTQTSPLICITGHSQRLRGHS
jgi:hypothetical protein